MYEKLWCVWLILFFQDKMNLLEGMHLFHTFLHLISNDIVFLCPWILRVLFFRKYWYVVMVSE